MIDQEDSVLVRHSRGKKKGGGSHVNQDHSWVRQETGVKVLPQVLRQPTAKLDISLSSLV